ncbi:hypothetical protein [Fodinibius salsisoli]|uniref:DUF3307 domain-containing protein n=1 Tax=Fodinibius salsisoli TaxID=2820877 RepID=A0ABT3PL46_9BACT|nr:hypothetical protein [Fodinibius salsisoli]MCW9706448.1 hypothetical protein [Fodinibius salsisoli]
MNYAIFLSILNLVLIARLRLIFRDQGASGKDLVIIGLLPLLILPFVQFNWSWLLLTVHLISYPFLMKWTEGNIHKLNRNRSLTLLWHILIAAILCSPLLNLGSNWLAQKVMHFLSWMFVPGQQIALRTVIVVQVAVAGLLLVINEMNILLRYILKAMGLESVGAQEDTVKVSEEEYSMGRLIGLLERIFIFIFVLLNQYSAIGFILAAKGVTRFNNFKDDRPFAEYVLIGTLLSTLLALIIGWGVKAVL